MNTEFWLKIGAKRDRPHAHLKLVSREVRSHKPSCGAWEVAIKINLSIPDAIFEKPTLEASIEVPESQDVPMIDVEVMDNLAQRLSEELSVTVRLSTGDPE